MPVLKTHCPECDAKLRLEVDGEGEHEVECPKCGHEFVAELDGDEPTANGKPKKVKKADAPEKAGRGAKEKAKAKSASKNGKPVKRRDDDDDDEDEDEEDRPKKKKKKGKGAEEGGSKKLIIAGAIAGVLLLGGAVAVIVAATSGKDKTAKKGDPPAEVKQPQQNPPDTKQPDPKQPDPKQPGPPKKDPDPKVNPNPGPPPKKDLDETELATSLPPPPKIRISGSLVPTGKPVVKPPAIPPLLPDEDPFERAKKFVADGPLPKPPPLPPRKERPLLTLEAGGHTDIIGKVFFTPKGDRVITIAQDKAVRIWDPATNETVKTIRFPAGPGKEGSLQAAAISRTGKQLAVSGFPVGTVAPGKVPIYIVDPETGAQLKRFDIGKSAITCMHYSNDGKWLAVGCENGTVQVVDIASGRSDSRQLTTRAVLEVKFRPKSDVKVLASLLGDRTVQIWNFANASQHKDFAIRGVVPSTLAWSNDGRTLAVGTTSGEIMLGTAEGQLVKSLPRISHGGAGVDIYQMQFLPGDNEIAVCGVAGQATGWAGVVDANTGRVKRAFTRHSNVVFALDVSADGKRVVTSGGSQHETFVWAPDSGQVLNRFVGGGNGVWAVAWAKDGKSLAWGTSNRAGENGEKPLEGTFRLDEFGVGDKADPAKYVQRLEFNEHVKLMVKASAFLVQPTGRDFAAIPAPPGESIYGATVLPRRNAVVVAASASLRQIDPTSGRDIRSYVGHTGNVLCVSPSPDGRLFATGSSDQTIRVWHRDHEEPLLSIFVSGRDWIAWTPQGYYACSGQGERLVAWQMPTTGRVPVVHPAERFRASMYRPALLKYIVPTADLPTAMAMAQKFDKALFETASVADVIPPEVTLDGFGEAEVKVDKDVLVVKATAKSAKHPITAMRLLVDGRPFQGAAGVKTIAAGLKEATATWEVPLTPGTHTVAVIADSAVSKGMSRVGVAVRPGEPPKPNLYVLAMGVGDYKPPINRLNFCASDAELLAKAFQEKSKGVFGTIEVKVLTDKLATKKGILGGLDWLKSKMTPQDVGIVSFSGHGSRDPFGQFYLCPQDMDPDDEDCATALSGKLFKDRLDEMPGRLVAILDACHSGTVAEKGPPPADTLVRDLTAEDSGVIVMCASAGREYAIETKITGAGFYTFGLVEGLSGLGDVDGDGVVYIHELDLYATARVQQLSMGRQNPTLGRPSTVRPFPIAKVEKRTEP